MFGRCHPEAPVSARLEGPGRVRAEEPFSALGVTRAKALPVVLSPSSPGQMFPEEERQGGQNVEKQEPRELDLGRQWAAIANGVGLHSNPNAPPPPTSH